MSIILINQLQTDMREKTQELEQIIQQVDHSKKWLFLSNRYNFDREMPFIFLFHEANQLLGVATLYAEDSTIAEITILVHPDFRNRKIATSLLGEIQAICYQYEIQEQVLKIESNFYSKHAKWLTHFQQNSTVAPEILLEMNQYLPNLFINNNPLEIMIAEKKEYSIIARILADAFDSLYYDELKFVEKISNDETMRLYAFSYHHQTIGTASIEIHNKIIYIYAVALAAKWQNKGFGASAISQLTHQLWDEFHLPIQIQVEKDNLRAINVYKKVGFEPVGEIIELIAHSIR